MTHAHLHVLAKTTGSNQYTVDGTNIFKTGPLAFFVAVMGFYTHAKDTAFFVSDQIYYFSVQTNGNIEFLAFRKHGVNKSSPAFLFHSVTPFYGMAAVIIA